MMDTQILPNQTDIEAAIGIDTKARGRRLTRRVVWAAVILVSLGGGIYYWQTVQNAKATVSFVTIDAELRDVTIQVTATGTIQPLTKVDVGSEVSGVVSAVNVSDNSLVKKGDVLATLDATRLHAQRDKADAQVIAANAKLETARASLEESDQTSVRQSRLRANGLGTAQDFDTAAATLRRSTAAVDTARAEIASARADLKLVESDIAKTVITSPIDGIVLKRSVEPGQTVAASLQAPILFTLAQDLSRMQLEANVDEADVGIVKSGQTANFTVDAYRGRSFPARIERLSYSPDTTDGVVTYKTILSAANDDLSLRPGMTATARIVVEQYRQALTIGNEAFRYAPPRATVAKGFSITQLLMPRFPRNESARKRQDSDGKRALYVLRDNAAVELRVQTGASDGKVTLITGGDLKAGDRVITALSQARP
jgi:HlyD family secretion protein